MGRPKKKSDRTTELETLRDGATKAERPDFYSAVKAEEVILKWERWKLEAQLFKARIEREKAEAKLATARAANAKQLAAAERKLREAEATTADVAAQEALRKSGNETPPSEYPNEFNPAKTAQAVGAGETLPKAGGGGH